MHFEKVLGFRASGSGFREKCFRGLNNEGASRELEEAWKGGKLVGRSFQGEASSATADDIYIYIYIYIHIRDYLKDPRLREILYIPYYG